MKKQYMAARHTYAFVLEFLYSRKNSRPHSVATRGFAWTRSDAAYLHHQPCADCQHVLAHCFSHKVGPMYMAHGASRHSAMPKGTARTNAGRFATTGLGGAGEGMKREGMAA